MSVIIKNAAPEIYFTGFDDQSARQLPIDPEATPIHCPLFFAFTQKGPEDALMVSGRALVETYGDETINYRSKFATHVTPFIRGCNAQANAFMLKRLRPEGAATATLAISLDLLPTQVPIYERNADGNYVLDASGARIPTGDTTDGFIGKWLVEPVTGTFAARTQRPGSQTAGAVQSTIYPIMDINASSFGSWANLVGVRFWAPTTRGLEPLDDELALSQKAYVYRAQIIRRPDDRSSGLVHRTLTSDMYVNFALSSDAVNTRLDDELFIDRVLLQAYRDLEDTSTGVPQYGPFNAIYVYHNTVRSISDAIYANESLLSNELTNAGTEYLVNLFGATTTQGVPYHSFTLLGALDGAAEMTEQTTHYLRGGDDGNVSESEFERLVGIQLDNFGDLDVPFFDMARYPISAFYDTGFDIEIKRKIPKLLGRRPDMHVALGVFAAARPELTISEESSMAVALRSALRVYPESVIFGTPTCRGVVVAQSGHVIGDNYSRKVPGTYELMMKRAAYAGAGSGFLDAETSYTTHPGNIVQFMRDIKNTSRPLSVRNRDWANGLVWIQNYDMTRQFFPAFQTVYDNDTSVLNSDMNMQIAVELNKVCFRVWRELVGNDKLTTEEFIQRSNELIVQKTQDRFDGRVEIRAETMLTKNDATRGYSWTTKVHMYGNVLKTVNVATVVTHRIEDLLS